MSGIDAILLTFRFLFQLFRLSLLAYRSRKAVQLRQSEAIDFNTISLEACIEEEVMTPASSRGHEHDLVPALNLDPHGIDIHDHPTTPSSRLDRPASLTAQTSYIHLKPTVYLELQNARAFGELSNLNAA